MLKTFVALGNVQVLQIGPTETVEEAVAIYRASGLVDIAEPDYKLSASVTPNDPDFINGNQWALHNIGIQGGAINADIHASQGWDTLHDASNVVVAVVDSGIRYTHQDLAGNIWNNPNEIPGNGIDDDHNGIIDDYHGVNAIVDGGDPMDDNGHGTHVAGIIGAIGNNGLGTVGVAWKVQLMACKFLDSTGNGDTSDAIQCIDYARKNGARIINASWGGPDYSSALYTAISNARTAGIIFVTAAGNDAQNLDIYANYPAGYNLDNILTVCATTDLDLFESGYSNYSSTKVHVGAPGTYIYSTWNGSDQSYAFESGTSMASPYVAGVCALLRARFPAENERQIIERVLASVDPLPSLQGKCSSGGRVNLEKALGPNPAAGFTASTFAAEPPASIVFTNTSSGDYTNLVWDFGDASALSSEETPSHSFAYPGLFKVKLTAMGVNGRNNSVERDVRITPNYSLSAEPYNWIDPSGMSSIATGDNGVVAQNLPFNFKFYGSEQSQIYVGANGVIGVVGTNAMSLTSPARLPGSITPSGLIAPYWDNLNPSAGGKVYFGIMGEAPNRKAVISWVNVPRNGSITLTLSFQAILEERSGDIVFQYLQAHPENKSGGGKKASIGIEDSSGSLGVSYTFLGSPLIVQNSTAIRFAQKAYPYLLVVPSIGTEFSGLAGTALAETNTFLLYNAGNVAMNWSAQVDVPWLDLTASSGTLAPGELYELPVYTTDQAYGLSAGEYAGKIIFTNLSNDQGNTSYDLDLNLIENLQARLEVLPPAAVGFSGGFGGPFTPSELVFSIKNSGSAPLKWLAQSSELWSMVLPTSSILLPGEQTDVSVILDDSAAQFSIASYHDSLTFKNEDDAENNYVFDLFLNVRGEIKPQAATVLNGQFEGGFSVPDEGSYIIEFSSDLVEWSELTTVSSADLNVPFVDTISAGRTRFYRARKL